MSKATATASDDDPVSYSHCGTGHLSEMADIVETVKVDYHEENSSLSTNFNANDDNQLLQRKKCIQDITSATYL